MNVVPHVQENDILYCNFNQDFTCISVGTKYGYKMYNSDPFGKCYGKFTGGTGVTEMLFCTALVALVGAGEQPNFSPRCLQIANTKRQTKVCELSFKTAVLAVKMNRKRLVVALVNSIHIYDITIMKLLHSLDTPPNKKGLVALSPNNDNNYLAYVASNVSGEILVFDALNLQAVTIIQAHKTPVSALSFNFNGTMLATSSGKGTVIRVFSVPDGQKLYQFRRGTYPAQIYSLSFNIQSTLLAVSSDSETIHIFKLDERAREQAKQQSQKAVSRGPPSGGNGGSSGVGGTMFGGWIPEAFTDMWQPERDFAWFKLPPGSIKKYNICAISNSTPLVMVATGDGYFYQYSLNAQDGGECVLLNRYSMLDPAERQEFENEQGANNATDVAHKN
eukprot:CFRG4413T1